MIPTITGLMTWLEADSGAFKDAGLSVPTTLDGDAVSGWKDQSGNDFNAVTVSGAPAIFRQNKLNGLPAIQFSGANFLSLGLALGKPREWTIFSIMATATPNVTQCSHGSCPSTGATALSWGNNDISQSGCPPASSAPDFGDGSLYEQSVTVGGIWSANVFNYKTLIKRDNDKAIQIFKNRVLLPTTFMGTNSITCTGPASNFSIGREGDYNGQYFNGMFASLVVYNRALLPVERKAVEDALFTKWGG